MSSRVFFNDVAQALADAGSSVHAAEAHGCLCGALCVRRNFAYPDWLEEVVPEPPEDDAHPERRAPLAAVYEQTVTALSGTDMEFSPLLPDDDDALEQRVEALGAWCHGFLYGFGSLSSGSRGPLPGDVDEVLADLTQISRVGAVGTEEVEIEESAYAELVEYLRAGTQLVYDELEPRRRAEPVPDSQH